MSGWRELEPLEGRLEAAVARVDDAPAWRRGGWVQAVRGGVAEAALPGASLGATARLVWGARSWDAEVVGLEADRVRLLLGGSGGGLPAGSRVHLRMPAGIPAGPGVMGRVIDGRGRPRDGRGPLRAPVERIESAPPGTDLEARRPIEEPLATGVRVVDGLLTLGCGQRMGVFAGPGAGKSTLLGQLAAGVDADVVVAALVGERAREVREMVEGPLASARERAVIVAATAEEPAVARARAGWTAASLAHWYRARGARVLLLFDSLTRFARALREVGLSAGEAPVRGGYPASALAALPRLLEVGGRTADGTVTLLATLLTEADRAGDVLADEVRGLLDGHLVLSHALAERGHFPAVDVGASVSRVMGRVTTPAHRRAAQRARTWWADYQERRELAILGAWEPGRDAAGDRALCAWPAVEAFVTQAAGEHTPFEAMRLQLMGMDGGP